MRILNFGLRILNSTQNIIGSPGNNYNLNDSGMRNKKLPLGLLDPSFSISTQQTSLISEWTGTG
jgi:hypothetical protein